MYSRGSPEPPGSPPPEEDDYFEEEPPSFRRQSFLPPPPAPDDDDELFAGNDEEEMPPPDELPPPQDGDFYEDPGDFLSNDEGASQPNNRVESPPMPPLASSRAAGGRNPSMMLPPPPEDEPSLIPKLRQMSTTGVRLSPNDFNAMQRRPSAARSPAIGALPSPFDDMAGLRSNAVTGTRTPPSIAPHTGGGAFDIDNVSMSSGNSSAFAERAKARQSPSISRSDGVHKTKLGTSMFYEVQGKFDGFEEDQFEPLLVRLNDGALCIRAEPGGADEEDITFDLWHETANIRLDSAEPSTIIVEHDGKRIILKCTDEAAARSLLEFAPEKNKKRIIPTQDSAKATNKPPNIVNGVVLDDPDDFWARLSSDPATVEELVVSDGASVKNSTIQSVSGRKESIIRRSSVANQLFDGTLAVSEIDAKSSNLHEDASETRYEYVFNYQDAKSSSDANAQGLGVHYSMVLPAALDLAMAPLHKGKRTSSPPRLHNSKKKGMDESDFDAIPQVRGYDRKVLLSSKLQKPLYSVRRVKQLCKWITSMHVWERPVVITNLHSEMCSGVLLCNIMKTLVPEIELIHVSEKVLSKRAAIENLEKALGIIWRSNCVNNARIPPASDIFTGNVSKIAVMIQEIFEVYVQRPLYRIASKMLNWYQGILKQYSKPLPTEIFSEGDLNGLWGHFQSGFSLFCVLYHLFGNATVGRGASSIRIDSLRMYSEPSNILEYRSNISYCFSILKALDIEVIWDPMDWITYKDTEFIVLQLFYIYDALKEKQCNLPPAQGTSAGVTSGPNGEPLVVGMVFADSRPVGTRAIQKKTRSVLLGSGDDSLALLPIDLSGDSNSSQFRMVCPRGLVSFNANAINSFVDFKSKQKTERRDWNLSSTNNVMSMSAYEVRHVENLKTKTTEAAAELRSKQVGTKSTNNLTTPTAEDHAIANTSLIAAMEELEKSMKDSQKELEMLENDLAERYLDLESKAAGALPPAEYNLRFETLEREALLLADERVRLEDHFAMRLQSIKRQYAENLGRASFTDSESNSVPTPMSPVKSAVAGSGASKTKSVRVVDDAVRQEQMKKAEKGWNAHYRRKETQNFALAKLQAEAQTALKVMWDPSKSHRELKKDLGTSGLRADLSEHASCPSVPLEVVSTWRAFAGRLAQESEVWRNSKEAQERAKRSTVEREVSAALETPTKVGIPIRSGYNQTAAKHSKYAAPINTLKSSSSALLGLHDEATARAIRSVESTAMEREDNYRSLWMSQQLQSQSTSSPSEPIVKKQLFSDPAATAKRRSVDVDTSLAYLSSYHRIFLADRYARKEYSWRLQAEIVDGVKELVLRWREVNNNSAVGQVNVSDIKAIAWSGSEGSQAASAATQLDVAVNSSPRALLGTGGRAVLSLVFASEQNCKQFGDALENVIGMNK